MGEHEAGDRRGIGEREQWERRGERLIRGDRDDVRVVGIEQRLAEGWPVNFKLWMRMPLEAFDDHDIDRDEADHQFVERRLGVAAQLTPQGPAAHCRHPDLASARLANPAGIPARPYDLTTSVTD